MDLDSRHFHNIPIEPEADGVRHAFIVLAVLCGLFVILLIAYALWPELFTPFQHYFSSVKEDTNALPNSAFLFFKVGD